MHESHPSSVDPPGVIVACDAARTRQGPSGWGRDPLPEGVDGGIARHLLWDSSGP
jgi:hypothetical protein